MRPVSKAEYFRKRRETRKHFNALLPRDKVEAIEARLEEQGKTKARWLEEKIDEELSKKENHSDALDK